MPTKMNAQFLRTCNEARGFPLVGLKWAEASGLVYMFGSSQRLHGSRLPWRKVKDVSQGFRLKDVHSCETFAGTV